MDKESRFMVTELNNRIFIIRHDEPDGTMRFSIIDKAAGCLLDTWDIKTQEEFDEFLTDMEYILGVTDALREAREKAAA